MFRGTVEYLAFRVSVVVLSYSYRHNQSSSRPIDNVFHVVESCYHGYGCRSNHNQAYSYARIVGVENKMCISLLYKQTLVNGIRCNVVIV